MGRVKCSWTDGEKSEVQTKSSKDILDRIHAVLSYTTEVCVIQENYVVLAKRMNIIESYSNFPIT